MCVNKFLLAPDRVSEALGRAVVPVTRFMLRVPGHRDLREEQRQQGEYRRLDEPHEELERLERHRQRIRDEEEDDEYQHLPREHVAEKAERERDEPRDFRHELYQAYYESDRRRKGDEFFPIPDDAERGD